MDCLFCRIAAAEVPGHLVHQDELLVAFLDHLPLFAGHVLVVPRVHVETLPELPPELVDPLFSLVRRLSAVVPAAMGAEGSFVAVNNKVSQSVPHLHVHVVPRRKKDGLRGFFWPRNPYSGDAERATVAARIAAQLLAGDESRNPG